MVHLVRIPSSLFKNAILIFFVRPSIQSSKLPNEHHEDYSPITLITESPIPDTLGLSYSPSTMDFQVLPETRTTAKTIRIRAELCEFIKTKSS